MKIYLSKKRHQNSGAKVLRLTHNGCEAVVASFEDRSAATKFADALRLAIKSGEVKTTKDITAFKRRFKK